MEKYSGPKFIVNDVELHCIEILIPCLTVSQAANLLTKVKNFFSNEISTPSWPKPEAKPIKPAAHSSTISDDKIECWKV